MRNVSTSEVMTLWRYTNTFVILLLLLLLMLVVKTTSVFEVSDE